jgi:hypothetical protein
MKFESIFLTMLFVACSSVCVLVMGAMLTASPSSSQLAKAHHAAPTVAMQADCAKPAAADLCGAPEA